MVFKYCRACLVTKVKMYNLNSTYIGISLIETYEDMMRISLLDQQQWICFECARLLQKYNKFKTKCHRANDLLLKANIGKAKVLQINILNMDRKQNKLISDLSQSPITNDSIPDNNEIAYVAHSNIQHIIEDCIIKSEPQTIDNNLEILEDNSLSNYENNQIQDYENISTENQFPEDSTLIKEKKQKTKDTKVKKDSKARKRKGRTTKINVKKMVDIENLLSDDEPLCKVLKDKHIDPDENKRLCPKNFNMAYFEGFATVKFLTLEDAKKEILLRKETSNYNKSEYKCDFCYKGYEAKTAFENHMKRHTVDSGEYECELCHIRFPAQRLLCKHRLACHMRKFDCKLCPYTCFSTNQAKTHVNLHKGKKYPCENCNEVFSMPNSLLMHKHLKHHITEYICDICGNSFATSRGLFVHKLKIHHQDKNEKLGPKCEDCGVHFATEVAWKKHLVLSSKHAVSNGCKFCGETFSNKEELKCHVKIHARKHFNRCNIKLPAACTICEKWLSDVKEYKSHMKSDHPQSEVAKRLDSEAQISFVCEICGKMFKLGCMLRLHQRAHAPGSGERALRCATCGQRFPQRAALAAHRQAHGRARPATHATHATHKCDVCARVFTFKSAFNKHMKIHLGIRPHKCVICEKRFISPCDVRAHIKYVHDKVPWPKKVKRKQNNTEEPTYIPYTNNL